MPPTCRSGSSSVSPQAIFVYSTYKFEAPTYGDESYPEWAVNVGWALAGVSVLQIPLWGLCVLVYYAFKGVSHRLWALEDRERVN